MGTYPATAKQIFTAMVLTWLFSTGFLLNTAEKGAGPGRMHMQSTTARVMPVGSLLFSPRQYFQIDDGTVGHESLSRVTISNSGSDTVTIYPPQLLAGNVSVRFTMTAAVTLAPAGIVDVDIHVTPLEAGAITGTVRLASTSSSQETIDLPLVGSAISLE